MAKITFLIPAHNAMPFLPYALESALAQTATDFDVLVIDDGSSDGTLEYLRSVKDARLRVLSQENRGLVATLNRGLQEISSPYVARLDADDVAAPNRLQLQMELLEQHPELAAVGAQVNYLAGRRTPFMLRLGRRRIGPSYGPPEAAPPFWHPLSDGGNLNHTAVTLRRDAVLAVGGYRPLSPAEDLDLWLRLSEHGYRLASLPVVLGSYRISTSGMSAQAFLRQRQMWSYIYHCAEQRRLGLPEPALEDYLNSLKYSPADVAQIEQHRQYRLAAGNLLQGHLLRGGGLLLRLLLANPGMISRRILLRLGIEKRPTRH